jgi:hypothetical protein
MKIESVRPNLYELENLFTILFSTSSKIVEGSVSPAISFAWSQLGSNFSISFVEGKVRK